MTICTKLSKDQVCESCTTLITICDSEPCFVSCRSKLLLLSLIQAEMISWITENSVKWLNIKNPMETRKTLLNLLFCIQCFTFQWMEEPEYKHLFSLEAKTKEWKPSIKTKWNLFRCKWMSFVSLMSLLF